MQTSHNGVLGADAITRGDNQAFEAWMAALEPWVRHQANAWRGVAGLDPDDVQQAAWLGLVEAARTYRDEGGVGFATWARETMRSRMVDAVKIATRQKHQPLAHTAELGDEPLVGLAPLDALVDSEVVREYSAALIRGLSPFELKVFRAMLRGLTLKRGAAWVGIPEKAFDNGMQRVRKKARALWEALHTEQWEEVTS